MNRLDGFRKSYIDSLKVIEGYTLDPVMSAITNWILTTEASLFSALPVGWGTLYSAQDCDALLGTINHALIDDGEISFPVVNGEPRIAFHCRWEDNYKDLVLHTSEKEVEARMGKVHTITFLETIDEFIQQRDLWEAAQLKRHFVFDVARHGLAFARTNYPLVTDEQVQDWQDDIAARVTQRKNLGM